MPITLTPRPAAGLRPGDGPSTPLGSTPRVLPVCPSQKHWQGPVMLISAHHFICFAQEVSAALDRALETYVPEETSVA